MQSRPGRAVFGVNAIVSVALIVLVAGVALVVNPPAPPGVAAFAPQASKPITKAPLGQSSINGTGSGSCAQGQPCSHPTRPRRASTSPRAHSTAGTTASAAPSTVTVPAGAPSALQCYAWPDGAVTQTFDPQSPPCIASWQGAAKGNGGSTSTGVTGTEIKVAFPRAASASTYDELQPIVDFVNTHFELYGRRFVLEPYTSQQATESGSGTYFDPSAQHADAVQVGSMRVFATTDFLDPHPYGGALPTYVDTLAQEHVISISGGNTAPLVTPGELATHAPYEWTYQPTSAELLANVGHFTCEQLVGHLAAHSSAYHSRERTFAILLPAQGQYAGPIAGVSALVSELKGCGVPSPQVVYYDHSNGGAENAALLKLKQQGITSLLFYPDSGAGQTAPQTSASLVDYTPEWITMGWEPLITSQLLLGPKSETVSTFGVAEWNKLAPLDTEIWVQALTAGGGSEADAQALRSGSAFYKEMLLLASGVQTAGPHLTPATFASGLRGTTFPNPGAAAAPTYQATVGFPGSSHTMVDDFTGFWLDASGTVAESSNVVDEYQAFCYVGLGRRYTNWPSTDRFYSGGCR